MNYDEIAAILKKGTYRNTFENFLASVNEEAAALRDMHDPPDEMESVRLAREYYAKDITEWLSGAAELEPHRVMGARVRHMRSWALANIIHSIQNPPDEEEEDVEVSDTVLLKLCQANSELGLQVARTFERLQDLDEVRRAAEDLTNIEAALNAAGTSTINALGNRPMTILERVEAVLEEQQDLRVRLADAVAEAEKAV